MIKSQHNEVDTHHLKIYILQLLRDYMTGRKARIPMRKKMIIRQNWFIFLPLGLICLFFFSFDRVSAADGNLQLNTDMITNSSNGKIGGSGDFPIKGSLFTSEMDQKIHNQPSFDPGQQLKQIDFQAKDSKNNQIDLSNSKDLLFKNYRTEGTNSEASSTNENGVAFYYVLVLLVIPFFWLAYALGENVAERKVRKAHVTNYD